MIARRIKMMSTACNKEDNNMAVKYSVGHIDIDHKDIQHKDVHSI